MGDPFLFPDVGEGIKEGKLVEWLIKEGDTIAVDQPIASVETDKAVVEIPTPDSGTVEKLLFSPGDTMEVGQPIMELAKGEGAAASPAPAKEETKPVPETLVPTPPPHQEDAEAEPVDSEPSDGTETGGILALPKVRKALREAAAKLGIRPDDVKGTGKDGRVTQADVNNLSGGTSPVSAPAPAPAINPAVVPAPSPSTGAEPSSSPSSARTDGCDVLATPSVRMHAREMGVDIATVAGSGSNGRVTMEDVKAMIGKTAAVKDAPAPDASASSPDPVPQPAVVDSTYEPEEERIPMSPTRKAISKHMILSLSHAAPFTFTDEADVTDLYALRKRENDKLKDKGIHLTFLPFFVKAVVAALRKHETFNATLDEETDEIIIKRRYHIGIATDAPEGLVVPVVRNADRKSILALAGEISDIVKKARDRKLPLDEMKGSTFTISSVGSIAGQVFTPIINYPEVAILGLGRIIEKPVVVKGELLIRKMIALSLTIDHRVIDGAEAARFIADLSSMLSDPETLLVEMI
ncbi:MAG: 2-oxo acid dehydrogenase subunit E2 [archaeon]